MSTENAERLTVKSHYDVIVIGAGFAGLPAAKKYLQIEPSVSLLIIDANRSVGGVWAKEKLYPGLRANNLLGTYEYPDFPMHEGFGVKKGDHIPGEVMHQYFRQYAEKFDLVRRLLLETKVKSAEKAEKGWKLTLEAVDAGEGQRKQKEGGRIITCDKLMVATGLTNLPAPIDILGSEDFGAPIVNFASFMREADKLLQDPSIKHATVIGTGKAAYDTVYLLATSGKRVTWIIRKSGHGPTYMIPSHVWVGPFYCWVEALTATRFFTFLSPCVWGNADGFGWWRSLLHGTRVGRWIIGSIWKKLGSDMVEQAGLNKHEKLSLLKPDDEALWYGTGIAILNYPSPFYDLVTGGQVEVLRKDVERLEGVNRIRFTDGDTVQTDALFSSSGWQFAPDIEFLPRNLHAEFGIPSTEYTKTQKETWDKLNARADVEILDRFPMLGKSPKLHDDPLAVHENLPQRLEGNLQKEKKEYAPWRLWRGLAPPLLKERNLVFLGMIANLQSGIRNDLAGVWAYAYMNGMLDSPTRLSREKPEAFSKKKGQHVASNGTSNKNQKDLGKESDDGMLYETALFNRFCLWRCPYGFGARYPDFVFDGIPFFDLLLRDLGVNSWRKGWGLVGEVFGGAYFPPDYRGVVEEWKKRKGLPSSSL